MSSSDWTVSCLTIGMRASRSGDDETRRGSNGVTTGDPRLSYLPKSISEQTSTRLSPSPPPSKPASATRNGEILKIASGCDLQSVKAWLGL